MRPFRQYSSGIGWTGAPRTRVAPEQEVLLGSGRGARTTGAKASRSLSDHHRPIYGTICPGATPCATLRRTLWAPPFSLCSLCNLIGTSTWRCPAVKGVYNELLGTPGGSDANIIELDGGVGENVTMWRPKVPVSRGVVQEKIDSG